MNKTIHLILIKINHIMKKFTWIPVLSLIVILFLSGCKRYQYISLNDHSTQNSPKSFVSENDTVKITYNFAGYNCPLTITVYNKLKTPIYIDWSQSSVITDGNKTALWSNNTRIYGSTSSTQINWSKNISTSSGDFQGVIYKDEKISFLPPHSYTRVTRIHLKNSFFKSLPKHDAQLVSLKTESGDETSVKLYSFNDQNAPMKFRVFLSVSTDKEFSKPLYVEKSFWTNKVFQSYTKPELLVDKQNSQCQVKKTTGFGAFMGVVLGVGILVLAAAMPK